MQSRQQTGQRIRYPTAPWASRPRSLGLFDPKVHQRNKTLTNSLRRTVSCARRNRSLMLPFFRRNRLYCRREQRMGLHINRPVLDFRTSRIFTQEIVALPILRWPNGPGHKAATTIGADVTQKRIDAGYAKSTFIATNARVERLRRERLVAVFAAGPKL